MPRPGLDPASSPRLAVRRRRDAETSPAPLGSWRSRAVGGGGRGPWRPPCSARSPRAGLPARAKPAPRGPGIRLRGFANRLARKLSACLVSSAAGSAVRAEPGAPGVATQPREGAPACGCRAGVPAPHLPLPGVRSRPGAGLDLRELGAGSRSPRAASSGIQEMVTQRGLFPPGLPFLPPSLLHLHLLADFTTAQPLSRRQQGARSQSRQRGRGGCGQHRAVSDPRPVPLPSLSSAKSIRCVPESPFRDRGHVPLYNQERGGAPGPVIFSTCKQGFRRDPRSSELQDVCQLPPGAGWCGMSLGNGCGEAAPWALWGTWKVKPVQLSVACRGRAVGTSWGTELGKLSLGVPVPLLRVP